MTRLQEVEKLLDNNLALIEAKIRLLENKLESDNRQISEYDHELRQAKRLLKAAVEDFAVYGALKDLSAEQRVQNPDWRRFNRVFDALSHQWRYADEALALIGNDIDVPATEGDTNVGRERRIENA